MCRNFQSMCVAIGVMVVTYDRYLNFSDLQPRKYPHSLQFFNRKHKKITLKTHMSSISMYIQNSLENIHDSFYPMT